METPCRARGRTGPLRRDADGTYWEMELGPYDMIAASFSVPGVRLYSPTVSWSDTVRAALEQRLVDLGSRAQSLGDTPLLEVLENSSFEQPVGPQGQIPGWISVAPPGASIRLDKTMPHEGTQSARLTSTGPTTTLVSRAFAPPATGRLAVSVWLRAGDAAKQPPVRLTIEGKMAEGVFRRFSEFGQAAAGAVPTKPIPTQWGHFILPVNDLPLESLSAVRVRFELLGPGEVWIDDVHLSEMEFDRNEQLLLMRVMAPGIVHLQNGQVADCIRLLEGYWPQFLVEHVPSSEPSPHRGEAATASAQPAPDADHSNGIFDRIKSFVPHRLRF